MTMKKGYIHGKRFPARIMVGIPAELAKEIHAESEIDRRPVSAIARDALIAGWPTIRKRMRKQRAQEGERQT